jgi:alpha-L-arabinofuranosidase
MRWTRAEKRCGRFRRLGPRPSPLAENTGDNREAIKPVTSSLAISGNEIRHTFPKLSLTVIALKRR